MGIPGLGKTIIIIAYFALTYSTELYTVFSHRLRECRDLNLRTN